MNRILKEKVVIQSHKNTFIYGSKIIKCKFVLLIIKQKTQNVEKNRRNIERNAKCSKTASFFLLRQKKSQARLKHQVKFAFLHIFKPLINRLLTI